MPAVWLCHMCRIPCCLACRVPSCQLRALSPARSQHLAAAVPVLPVPVPAAATLPPLAPALALPPCPGVTRPISASRAGPPPLWLRSLSLFSAPASPLARRVSTGCPGSSPGTRGCFAPRLRQPLSLSPLQLLLSASSPPKAPLSPCCPHPGPHRGPHGGAGSRPGERWQCSTGGARVPLTGALCPPSYGTLPSRRALKNSRLVSQKDDVHLCIMCLRAIMNYQVPPSHGGDTHRCHRASAANAVLALSPQYGFNLVMSHPHAVNEIALSLNNKNPR